MGLLVSRKEVWNVVSPLVNPFWAPPTPDNPYDRYVGFADERYYLPSQEEIQLLLEQIPKEPLGFFGETFDCDDYSFLMKGTASVYARKNFGISAGLCLGIAWGKFSWKSDPAHSCNWVLDDTKHGFFWLEPQDRKLRGVQHCLGGLVLLLV